MAISGTQILNPRTGQRSVFLQTARDTGGKLFQMESFHPAHSPAEPEHTHPFQESRCKVLAGTLRFSVDGAEKVVKPGETLIIPPGPQHRGFFRGLFCPGQGRQTESSRFAPELSSLSPP